MSVGSRIKELREDKNLTRNELADLLGVTVGSISNYENEVSSPKEPILFKIMEVLKCDANYLFQDAVNMPSMKNSVSTEEHKIIKKYRKLDVHGKEMVDFTLEKEYERSIKDTLPLHDAPTSSTIKIVKNEDDHLDDGLTKNQEIHTIAAHHDNKEWTKEELDEIEELKRYALSKRKNNMDKQK